MFLCGWGWVIQSTSGLWFISEKAGLCQINEELTTSTLTMLSKVSRASKLQIFNIEPRKLALLSLTQTQTRFHTADAYSRFKRFVEVILRLALQQKRSSARSLSKYNLKLKSIAFASTWSNVCLKHKIAVYLPLCGLKSFDVKLTFHIKSHRTAKL